MADERDARRASLTNPRSGENVPRANANPGDVLECDGDCAVIASDGSVRTLVEGFVPPFFRVSAPQEN